MSSYASPARSGGYETSEYGSRHAGMASTYAGGYSLGDVALAYGSAFLDIGILDTLRTTAFGAASANEAATAAEMSKNFMIAILRDEIAVH